MPSPVVQASPRNPNPNPLVYLTCTREYPLNNKAQIIKSHKKLALSSSGICTPSKTRTYGNLVLSFLLHGLSRGRSCQGSYSCLMRCTSSTSAFLCCAVNVLARRKFCLNTATSYFHHRIIRVSDVRTQPLLLR
jgi:hypothetical protein